MDTLDRISNYVNWQKVKGIIQKYVTLDMIKFLWRHHRLVLIAGLGLFGALMFTFVRGRETTSPANQLTLPPSSPYTHNISGSGYVEANSQNIGVGAFTTGVVSKVSVTPGQHVKKGDPLFLLDDRTAAADLRLRESEVDAAEANLAVAKVALAETQDLLDRGKGLKAGFSISKEDLLKREFAVQKAKVQVTVNESQVEQARAQLEAASVTLDKLTVMAPVDGLIMKVNVRPGEYISQLVNESTPPVLIGNITPLHIRVQIDENDAWRLNKEAKAHAYLKSNQRISFPLKLVRIEPYALPKSKLGGDSSELIDTRILECIYEIGGEPQNIYVGQQLDIFIEAREGP